VAGRTNVNLKKAPRRDIVDVARIGSWGRVEYHHKLECGHTEVRKRATTSGTMACAGCVLSEEYQDRGQTVEADIDDDILDLIGSQIALNEENTQSIKVELARRLNLPAGALEIIVDYDEAGEQAISGAVIVLSADEILRIISEPVETNDA
jgi:hypothetical protein